MEKSSWNEFEKKVASLFKLFGYEVTHDTKISSGQVDVHAYSGNRFKPNLLIECKHHDNYKNKVGVNEVENFVARILMQRSKGEIDQGYLVTNTDFTSSAKELVHQFKNFIFLSTYDSLLQQIVDTEYYLKSYVENYERNNKDESFVNLVVSDLKDTEEIRFDYNLATDNRNMRHPFIEEDPFIEDVESIALVKRSLKNMNLEDVISVGEKFVDENACFMILLGDYGSGKSTSLSHLMYVLCKKKIENPQDMSIRIPLLINLKNYNKVVDFDSLLNNFFQNELGYSNISLPIFKKMNELGHFIILLDGYDEMARLVTPLERRLTFQEISKQLTEETKIILSSRPGYFPENKEMYDLINKYLPKSRNNNFYSVSEYKVPLTVKIYCLQLMNLIQVSEYLRKTLASNPEKLNKFLTNMDLQGLITRPILANIVIETIDEIQDLPPSEISLYKLYTIYSDKWTKREQDKGFFRVLIEEQDKKDFIGLLAIQMFESRSLKINYKDLDQRINIHFLIKEKKQLDHFSHDIRTCSFLTRDDQGNYSFIHKSFMEFFVASEFLLFEESVYSDRFTHPFKSDILKFIDLYKSEDLLPENLKVLSDLLKKVRKVKTERVNAQKYELAAMWRDLERRLEDRISLDWPSYNDNYEDLIDEWKVNKKTL